MSVSLPFLLGAGSALLVRRIVMSIVKRAWWHGKRAAIRRLTRPSNAR
jgi:hypothetical protein